MAPILAGGDSVKMAPQNLMKVVYLLLIIKMRENSCSSACGDIFDVAVSSG